MKCNQWQEYFSTFSIWMAQCKATSDGPRYPSSRNISCAICGGKTV